MSRPSRPSSTHKGSRGVCVCARRFGLIGLHARHMNAHMDAHHQHRELHSTNLRIGRLLSRTPRLLVSIYVQASSEADFFQPIDFVTFFFCQLEERSNVSFNLSVRGRSPRRPPPPTFPTVAARPSSLSSLPNRAPYLIYVRRWYHSPSRGLTSLVGLPGEGALCVVSWSICALSDGKQAELPTVVSGGLDEVLPGASGHGGPRSRTDVAVHCYLQMTCLCFFFRPNQTNQTNFERDKGLKDRSKPRRLASLPGHTDDLLRHAAGDEVR